MWLSSRESARQTGQPSPDITPIGGYLEAALLSLGFSFSRTVTSTFGNLTVSIPFSSCASTRSTLIASDPHQDLSFLPAAAPQGYDKHTVCALSNAAKQD